MMFGGAKHHHYIFTSLHITVALAHENDGHCSPSEKQDYYSYSMFPSALEILQNVFYLICLSQNNANWYFDLCFWARGKAKCTDEAISCSRPLTVTINLISDPLLSLTWVLTCSSFWVPEMGISGIFLNIP